MKFFIPSLFCLCMAGAASGALTTFDSRPTFNIAAPGTQVEDFEEAAVADNTFQTITGPLSSSNLSAFFSSGSLLPGFAIQDGPGPDSNGLIVLGNNVLPNVTKAILINTFADSGDLLFANGVLAVGFDLWTALAPGSIGSTQVSIEVFAMSGGSLGVFSTNSSSSSGTFWGVVSDSARIGRINIFSAGNLAETVDNLTFDSPVPEPSTWLSVLLGGAAIALRAGQRTRH